MAPQTPQRSEHPREAGALLDKPGRSSTPRILALDFDGVVCEGRPEYFESSCRAYGHFWSPSSLRARGLKAGFWRLRPVIMSGWEMPLLVRALVVGTAETRALRAWTAVREELLRSLPAPRDELVKRLRDALDGVRRDWLSAQPDEWLGAHRPYVQLATLRRIVAAPEHTVVVTTKEGEFTRRILAHWDVAVADVQGKEAGEHKCENLIALMDRYRTTSLAFVEDRLETLECVRACARRQTRLAEVRLYLAAWGYNTPAARAAARRDPSITLLPLSRFARGPGTWPIADRARAHGYNRVS